jgi:hypothetical protein
MARFIATSRRGGIAASPAEHSFQPRNALTNI